MNRFLDRTIYFGQKAELGLILLILLSVQYFKHLFMVAVVFLRNLYPFAGGLKRDMIQVNILFAFCFPSVICKISAGDHRLKTLFVFVHTLSVEKRTRMCYDDLLRVIEVCWDLYYRLSTIRTDDFGTQALLSPLSL